MKIKKIGKSLIKLKIEKIFIEILKKNLTDEEKLYLCESI